MTQQFLTTEEIAEILKVHEETVRRYIRSGRLPAIKIGGVYRVLREDFEEFIRESKVRPEQEPEE